MVVDGGRERWAFVRDLLQGLDAEVAEKTFERADWDVWDVESG